MGIAYASDVENPDAHPALIDRETWRLAQRAGQRTHPRSPHPSPLSGLMRCAGCRYVMRAERRRQARGEVRAYVSLGERGPRMDMSAAPAYIAIAPSRTPAAARGTSSRPIPTLRGARQTRNAAARRGDGRGRVRAVFLRAMAGRCARPGAARDGRLSRRGGRPSARLHGGDGRSGPRTGHGRRHAPAQERFPT